MFVSDTRADINSLPIDSVLGEITDVADTRMPSPRVRLNYVKMLYDVLGFDLSPDAALALVAEPPAQLVLSTAGGGKTTWSQIKAIEQKLLRKSKKGNGRKITGDKILCLVYNVHNVKDMQEKHARMVNRLLAAGIEGLQIDTNINACTMHSFCEFCRKRFVARLGYVGFTLATEDEAVGMMYRAIKVVCKMLKVANAESIPAAKVHSLYTMCKETLKEVVELTQTDLFEDVGLPVNVLESIFERFNAIKRKGRRFEFIDMLYDVYSLLKDDQKSLSQVQEYYEYVIADEVQDFTPLMWELLRLFVNDGTPLTCIGDEDQNIYSFRGASIQDTLHFRDRFTGGKIYALSKNRRCPKAVLDEARRVIGQNKLRFAKEIMGDNEGGSIRVVPYSTEESQVTQLIRELKKLSVDEWNDTVVCYRNQEGSRLISEMLAEEGIDFCCIKAFMPYSFELYNHLIGLFNALEMPYDRECFKQLWKVLPCKKKEFFEVIGYNAELKRFTSGDNKIHFAEYNYGRLMNYRGFADAMDALIVLSGMIEKEPLSSIFPLFYKMLCTYFWKYRRSTLDESLPVDVLEKKVEAKFNVAKKYSEVYREIQNTVGICRRNTSLRAGVTLSTFHSLKGLEFSHVFAMQMDNSIFPNFPLIEYKSYGPEIEMALKEAETRLWYVAVTRSKKDLTIFYYRDNPSKYVAEYLQLVSKTPTGEEGLDFVDVEEFAECLFPEPEVGDNTMPFGAAADEEGVLPAPVAVEAVNSFKQDTRSSSYLQGLFNNL